MKKITIVDDNDNQYDIYIRALSEDPKQEFPDAIDIGITINGKEYSGTVTKD